MEIINESVRELYTIWAKLIPYTFNGLDITFTDLLSELSNMYIYRAHSDIDIIAPDAVQQLIPGIEPPLIAHKMFQLSCPPFAYKDS